MQTKGSAVVGRLVLLVAGGVALVWVRDGEIPLHGTASTSGVIALLGDVSLHMTALIAAWATAAALLGALRGLPGRLGHLAGRAWVWLVPVALRVALLGTAGAAAAASHAAAADPPSSSTTAHWEVGRPQTTAPTTWPAASADEPVHRRVVTRGESLWAIAEQHLGPTATPAQVAAEWPRWYAANRDVVGPDPDLLRVGVVLEAPAAGGTP